MTARDTAEQSVRYMARIVQLEAEIATLRVENAALRAAQVPAQREPQGRRRPPIADDVR